MRAIPLMLVASGLLVSGCGDRSGRVEKPGAETKNGDTAGMQMGDHAGMGGMQMMPIFPASPELRSSSECQVTSNA
jgi:hypothetical protein